MLLEFDGTFIFALISFIIFVFLMNLILYRPMNKIIEERQKFFDKNAKTKEECQEKSAKLLEEKEAEITGAKIEASNILKVTKETLKKTKEETIKSKKSENLSKLTSNREILLQNKKDVQNELKNEINGYVKIAVAKVLNCNVDDIQTDPSKVDRILEGKK